jgi:pyruvate ferredoxin oxidoreductase alpha subunit
MSISIAEDKDVLLPVMSCLDGFITTHSIDRAETMDDESVSSFVGDYEPQNALLDFDNPSATGTSPDSEAPYFEFKRSQRMAMDRSKSVIERSRRGVLKALRPAVRHGRDRHDGRRRDRDRRHRLDRRKRAPRREAAAGRGREGGLVKVRCFRPFPAS